MRQRKNFYSLFLQIVTDAILYTVIMKNLLITTTPRLFTALLSATAVGGVFCIAFLFALCFICVHILKCVEHGFKRARKPPEQPNPPTEQKEKAPAPPQEPIYYIVERKRSRAKPKYGEPKEIRFK